MINHIDLINGGLNINPIPFEFSEELTTTKVLLSMQSSINSIIDIVNNWESSCNSYTDAEIKKINNELTNINRYLETGEKLQNETIKSKHLSNEFFKFINNIVNSAISDSIKSITFTLDEKGRLNAIIPSTYKEVTFSTDEQGRLVIIY